MLRRLRSTCRVILAVALLLAVASCTDRGEVRRAAGTLLPASAYQKLSGGKLYLLLGQPSSGNVWRVDISTKRDRQITHNPQGFGVSWISGSSAGVVLADARRGVDELAELHGDTVVPRPEGHTVTPAINEDGQIAFVQIPDIVNKSEPQNYRIAITSDNGIQPHSIYGQPLPLAALAWGPDRKLAFISIPEGMQPRVPPELLVLDADGQVSQRLHPRVTALSAPVWSPAAPAIAVNGSNGSSEVIFRDLREIALPAGWLAGCWNPQGTVLLLTKNDRIGLWRPTRPKGFQELGRVRTGPVTGCSWVPESRSERVMQPWPSASAGLISPVGHTR